VKFSASDLCCLVLGMLYGSIWRFIGSPTQSVWLMIVFMMGMLGTLGCGFFLGRYVDRRLGR